MLPALLLAVRLSLQMAAGNPLLTVKLFSKKVRYSYMLKV